MQLEDLILTTPYLTLDEEFFRETTPEPLDKPYLIHFNQNAAKLIDLDTSSDNPDIVKLLNGDFKLEGSTFFAMCYAGHQFGHYNPWLGDGRAHNLGKKNGWNLQLKGSGETLYSRGADGRAAMRSSIREYLMSEAMFHLGIPTTRALGIIGSKTEILRKRMEPSSIVMRMSKSWIRFGSFEYFYYRKQNKKLEELAEYVINESFPHLKNSEDRFFQMFCEVLERTAKLIANWQGVGFNHGVMNTDNMSIEGLTIDYGPYAMLDDFNYNFICSTSDKMGRYAYGEQPNISYWNLTKLSEALSPIISKEKMQKKLDEYGAFIYPTAYITVMRQKLGLLTSAESDANLVESLVVALHEAYVDHTLFFRTLSHYDGDRAPLYDIAMNPIAIDNWLKLYDARLVQESSTHKERQKKMLKTNPKYVLKNYMLEQAINRAELGDFKMVENLITMAEHPYDELPEFEAFAGDTPEEFKNIALSCSS
jgi:serine/tyrosine/threonine adenylyltransferase